MYPRVLRIVWSGIACCSVIACSAKAPGPIETRTAYWVKRHITVGGRPDKNPIPATRENVGPASTRSAITA
jgi:hypothetical protein